MYGFIDFKFRIYAFYGSDFVSHNRFLQCLEQLINKCSCNMGGRKCCVPNCKSNYDSVPGYTTVFRFPKEPEKKALWLKKIARSNFVPSKNSVVCAKHFQDDCIITYDVLPTSTGPIKIMRVSPKLKGDACPTIFEGCPKYLSETKRCERTVATERIDKMKKLDDADIAKWLPADIASQDCLMNGVKTNKVDLISTVGKVMEEKNEELESSESECEAEYILNMVTDSSDSSSNDIPENEHKIFPEDSPEFLSQHNNDAWEDSTVNSEQNVINSSSTDGEEHPNLVPLIVKTETLQPYICISSTVNRPSTCLPASNNWEGVYDFKIKVNYPSVKKGESAAYLETQNKLYICKDFAFKVLISASNVPPGSVIRTTALFSSAESAFEVVERCPIHIQQDIAKGEFAYGHVVQSLNNQVRYEKSQVNGRYSVIVPYEEPQVGELFSTYVYKLTCFSSCAGGINRRPVMLVFTLENEDVPLGRQKLEVKICACPVRDLNLELKKIKLNGICQDFISEAENSDSNEHQADSNYTITVKDDKLYNFLMEMKSFYEAGGDIKNLTETAFNTT